MKYFIDTNIFLRVLVKENEKQYSDCVSFLQKIQNDEFNAYTGTIVFAEVYWTLTTFYKFSKEKSLQGLKSIISLNGLSICDEYDLMNAILICDQKSVKFTDCLIASNLEIREKKMTIVSFDHDFDKFGILRKEPGSVLSLK